MNPTPGMAGRAAVMVSASVLAAMLATPSAFADTTQATLGGQADVGGGQQWTVSALRPSADLIAYSPAGTLWEATATNRPAAGGVPMVPGFAARAGAANYPVLWPVPTALGINPSALPAGGSVTGKLYFDVVGPSPVEVVFVTDGADAARWVTPPPPPGGAGAPSYAPRAVAPAPVAAPPAPVAAAPATPPPSGSSGTPLPAAGSQGTPLPAEDPVTPSTTPQTAPSAPSTATAPTAAPPATAAAAPQAADTPAAGSQGTPLPSDSAPPATAATPSTAAAAPAPTTTAVPAG